VRWAGRRPGATCYRHIHSFASTVLDRIYFVRGQMQAFDVTMRGDAGCDETIAARRGGLLLGAHLGSFESLHAAGKSFPGMRVTMVMYPDNARKIHSVLQAVAPDFKLAVIPIGNVRSTLAIRDALDDGCLVGMLGDRMLGGDAARAGVVKCPSSACRRRFPTARCAWPCCCAGGSSSWSACTSAANATTCASRPWPISPSRRPIRPSANA
jgi:predicted LPLAT superfamily acyltransferase